ncbi:hypothetical protein JTB14_020015 [Gonioctena quinquepunctata]|nr:hypothetical protein JTB14_020015 [Gonioctena quinquepunctata]
MERPNWKQFCLTGCVATYNQFCQAPARRKTFNGRKGQEKLIEFFSRSGIELAHTSQRNAQTWYGFASGQVELEATLRIYGNTANSRTTNITYDIAHISLTLLS